MTAREDLQAAFVDAMQDGNWHMTADEDHAKATAMVDAAINEALQAAAGQAEAAIERIRTLHIPARGGRSGYQPDDDDTPGAYGHIASACEECGSQDLAVRWPCPTIQALETT